MSSSLLERIGNPCAIQLRRNFQVPDPMIQGPNDRSNNNLLSSLTVPPFSTDRACMARSMIAERPSCIRMTLS